MQIEVVDDGSWTDAAMEACESVAPGRISHYRIPENQGLAGCWNTCIKRAKGQFVHILHQDDYVLPGFYAALQMPLIGNPSIGAAFTRHLFVDSNNRVTALSPEESPKSGPLNNWLHRIAAWQRIQTPAMVVRRSVYEDVGGFDPRLVYAIDWEMWIRIAMHHGVWYEPRPLACYRVHENSETANLRARGEIVADLKRAIQISRRYTRAKVGDGPSRVAYSECAQVEAYRARIDVIEGRFLQSLAKLLNGLSMCRNFKAIRALCRSYASGIKVRLRGTTSQPHRA